MTPDVFREKINAARLQFIQELADGCNDCVDDESGFGLCQPHAKIAAAAELRPKECPEFQEFLKLMGLVKP